MNFLREPEAEEAGPGVHPSVDDVIDQSAGADACRLRCAVALPDGATALPASTRRGSTGHLFLCPGPTARDVLFLSAEKTGIEIQRIPDSARTPEP